MPRHKIEFTPGPVTADGFVGRADETMEVLLRAMMHEPPVQSIVGPSKIGRTSMLRHLRAEAAERSGDTTLIAPLVDLTAPRTDDENARDRLLRGIATELASKDINVGPLPSDLTATTVVGQGLERAAAGGHRVLLLVDRAEYLLTRPGDRPAAAAWSRMAMETLGELNERVPMAVVLAFGSTGPASKLNAIARELGLVRALEELSQLLNRGNLTRTTLPPLTDEEVREFAKRASISGLAGRSDRASKVDVEWIVDLAGGHPLVMQLAGVRLFEAKVRGDTESEREALAQQIADPGLQGFVYDAFERIGHPDADFSDALRGLTTGEPAELPAEVVAALVEEGLAHPVGADAAMMPSRALRMALGVYLKRLSATSAWPPVTRPRATAAPAAHSGGKDEPQSAELTLVLADESGRALRLTRSEYAIMTALLGAADTVPRDELRAALGPNATNHQLNQRVSVLRAKLSERLGVADAIANVYGEGYRLVSPERFQLMG